KFGNCGNFLGLFGSGYNSHPESILFDASGNIYIGQADGLKKILKFNPAGTLLDSFTPTTGPRGTDWIELAADQCTMFYSSEGTIIRRYNVCTHSQLPDFATLPHGLSYALRLLPTGGMLVADTSEVLR